MEIWEYIPGYEGLYKISNYGRIMVINLRGSGKQHIMTPILDGQGYARIGLTKNGKTKTYRVHRLVAITFIHNENNKPEVNHKNELKWCNCVWNLEWCSSKENSNWGTRNKRVGLKNSISQRGKHLSEEHKRKLSEVNKGKHHSEDTKLKMSRSSKHCKPSDEHRKKLSKRMLGNKNTIGTKWYNNGIINKRLKMHPGEGWVEGRLHKKLEK